MSRIHFGPSPLSESMGLGKPIITSSEQYNTASEAGPGEQSRRFYSQAKPPVPVGVPD